MTYAWLRLRQRLDLRDDLFERCAVARAELFCREQLSGDAGVDGRDLLPLRCDLRLLLQKGGTPSAVRIAELIEQQRHGIGIGERRRLGSAAQTAASAAVKRVLHAVPAVRTSSFSAAGTSSAGS